MTNDSLKLAGYLRISVDIEKNEENVSIENQRRIIEMYVAREFPNSQLDFYEDRDRSGYTFEQRESYMELRPKLINHEYDILIVKDLSRFSRRNSKGLVELEDLRDSGLRIIAVNDGIDYPVRDDWTLIQFKFLMNEMPVTDTSKKVKKIIDMRQKNGEWICSVPYGYNMLDYKQGIFEVDKEAALIVKKIFSLYLEGWGYKKIANYLTDEHIPTPRMIEKQRKEAIGAANKIIAKPEWSIITVQGILTNDFYIGTLRQHKYTRSKINGPDKRIDENDQIVFENHHEAIIDYKTFAATQEQLKKRSTSHYRGVKKYDTSFSGFLYCGDCGSPMFSMSRPDMAPAYVCGLYHRRGLKGCTSHHTRVDMLTSVIKSYVKAIMENSKEMMTEINKNIAEEEKAENKSFRKSPDYEDQLLSAKEELKITMREKVRQLQKNPSQADILEETYDELLTEIENKIIGIEKQIEFASERENTVIRVNRIAKTALDIFNDILNKELIDKTDLDIVIQRIDVYDNHVDIQLKDDIQMLLETGTISPELLPDYSCSGNVVNFKLDIESISKAHLICKVTNQKDKALDVNVISDGDPLEIFTDHEGEVIFKKYSPIGEIGSFAWQYAEAMHKVGGYPVIISDRDHVIAASGLPKREVQERRVSQALEDLMEERRSYTLESPSSAPLYPVEGIDKKAIVSVPIISSGDVCGAVSLLAGESPSLARDSEIKMAGTAAVFLGKQLEN